MGGLSHHALVAGLSSVRLSSMWREMYTYLVHMGQLGRCFHFRHELQFGRIGTHCVQVALKTHCKTLCSDQPV